MKLLGLSLSVLLLALAAAQIASPCLVFCVDGPSVWAGYQDLWRNDDPTPRHQREALRANPHSPYRWCDLGEALQRAGNVQQADFCFRQARELDPHGPPILLRSANFAFTLGRSEEGNSLVSNLLAHETAYDSILFGYFDRFGLGLQVLPDRRSAEALLRYRLERGSWDQSTLWTWLTARSWAGRETANRYLKELLERSRYREAGAAWAQFSPLSKIPLHNGDFEMKPDGTVFDWQIATDQVAAALDSSQAHSGSSSLLLQYTARSAPETRPVRQFVLAAPGDYLFRAFVKQSLPQVAFRIFDPAEPGRLDVTAALETTVQETTAKQTTAQDWRELRKPVHISAATPLVEVDVLRRGSQPGAVWIDSVSLQ